MSKPWIGNHYFENRLLLLGESAYSWQDDEDEEINDPSPQHSIDLVKWVLGDLLTNPFMTKLTRALADKETPDQQEREHAWHNVAFTNYVPGTVGFGARLRPTDQMWFEAATAFPGLLEQLRPKNVIVLGKEMWKRMPEVGIWLTDDVQGYRLSDGQTTICWTVNHPSAGLSWARLAAVIKFAQNRTV